MVYKKLHKFFYRYFPTKLTKIKGILVFKTKKTPRNLDFHNKNPEKSWLSRKKKRNFLKKPQKKQISSKKKKKRKNIKKTKEKTKTTKKKTIAYEHCCGAAELERVSACSESLAWLRAQQGADGCYRAAGMVHHRQMRGGYINTDSPSPVAITAYVVAALLEAGESKYVSAS